MLIVTVIVALTLMFALAGNNFFFEKTYEETIQNKLLYALHLARASAISREELVILSKDQTWQKGFIISTKDEKLQLITNPHNPGLLYWRAFPKNRLDVQFSSNGFLNAENGTFWFCQPNKYNPSWAIVLSQTGRERIILPNKEGYILLGKNEKIVC